MEWETKLGFPRMRIAGVDEVGRGCLAGPVVAGAVLLPPVVDYDKHPWLSRIADSKFLKPGAREELAPLIRGWADCAIGIASVEEIDQLNIYQATHLAMKRALSELRVRPEHAIIDGKFVPSGTSIRMTAVVKGDQKCLSVAAASIVAKVWRDQRMDEFEELYKGYGFAKHKGYGTPAHLRALKDSGVCQIHRRSFAPVKQCCN